MLSMRQIWGHLAIHCVIGNLINATCQIGPWCAVSSQTDVATLRTKGAQFFGQGPMDRMSTALSHLGTSVKNITWTTRKRYFWLRPTMERTVFGHGLILQETMSGLRRTWWSSLQMDSGLHTSVRIVSGQTNFLPMVIRFVDTHGNHIDLTKQVTTSCSHHFAGIRASTTTNSTKHSSKRNYLRLPWWAKTWDAWPALRGGIDKNLRKIICPKIKFEVWKLEICACWVIVIK